MSMNRVTIEFVTPEGQRKKIVGEQGENLLHLAHENDVELEGKKTVTSSHHCISIHSSVMNFLIVQRVCLYACGVFV